MSYLDSPFENDPPPVSVRLSIKAFNMMGGVVDYSALPLVAEYLEINDIETLITELLQIEQYAREKRNEETR